MADIHAILKKIEARADDLVKKHNQVKKNCVNLKAENEELTEKLNQKTQLLNKIEEELKALQIAKNIGSDVDNEEKKKMKKQLEQYIKEIDGCLSILNQ